jgi:hypothetical protein
MEEDQGAGAELIDVRRPYEYEGGRLAGYGAPAKGNTLLCFLEIGPDTGFVMSLLSAP